MTKLETAWDALRKIQWGSCDGCNGDGFCPECKQMDPKNQYDDVEFAYRYGHKPTCSVGLVLAATNNPAKE